MQSKEHFPVINRLHTDSLEEKYGTISVEVIRHDSRIREANLRDSLGISRTFAITVFPQCVYSESLTTINKEIQRGALIGKTFRQHGYEIRKNVLEVLIVELPIRLRVAFSICTDSAKARLSEFLARYRENSVEFYGTVIEIYHPDFRSPHINTVDRTQEGLTLSSLTEVGIFKDEIWDGISDGHRYDFSDPRYSVARQISNREILLIKKQIFEILKSIR